MNEPICCVRAHSLVPLRAAASSLFLWSSAWYILSLATLWTNRFVVAELKVESNVLSLAQLGMSVLCGLASEVSLVGWDACKASARKLLRDGLKDMVVLGAVRILTVLLGLTALKYIAVSFTRTWLALCLLCCAVSTLGPSPPHLLTCACGSRDDQVVGAVFHSHPDVLPPRPAHGLARECVAAADRHGLGVLQPVGHVLPLHRLHGRAALKLRRLHTERTHQEAAQSVVHVSSNAPALSPVRSLAELALTPPLSLALLIPSVSQLQLYTSVIAVAMQLAFILYNWAAFPAYHGTRPWHGDRSQLYVLALLVGDGLGFYFQSAFAYLLMSLVSPVTHSVANCVKRALLIMLSIFHFGDIVTPLNWSGMVLVIFGVYFFTMASRLEREVIGDSSGGKSSKSVESTGSLVAPSLGDAIQRSTIVALSEIRIDKSGKFG